MEDDAFGVLHHDEHHALDVSFDGLLLSLEQQQQPQQPLAYDDADYDSYVANDMIGGAEFYDSAYATTTDSSSEDDSPPPASAAPNAQPPDDYHANLLRELMAPAAVKLEQLPGSPSSGSSTPSSEVEVAPRPSSSKKRKLDTNASAMAAAAAAAVAAPWYAAAAAANLAFFNTGTTTSKATVAAADQLDKRQHRLMKNREAADLSRKRRKEQMSLLEERVQQLEQENTALKMHLAEYERQFGPLSNISNMALPLPVSSTATPSPRPSGRRVAFVLMFMVLSVFVVAARYQPSADSARAISSLSLHTGRSILSADIAVVPPAPTKKAEGRKVALSTVLQPADKDEGGNDAQDKEGDSKTLYPPFGINLNDSHTYVDTDDLRSWIDQAIAHAQPSQQPVPIQYQQHRQVAQNPHSADENNNAVALQTNYHYREDPYRFLLGRPDTAYMFCQQVFQVLPNEKPTAGTLPRMSLLVPYHDPSQHQHQHQQEQQDNSVVQIDCQVLGTHVIKYTPAHTGSFDNDTVVL